MDALAVISGLVLLFVLALVYARGFRKAVNFIARVNRSALQEAVEEIQSVGERIQAENQEASKRIVQTFARDTFQRRKV